MCSCDHLITTLMAICTGHIFWYGLVEDSGVQMAVDCQILKALLVVLLTVMMAVWIWATANRQECPSAEHPAQHSFKLYLLCIIPQLLLGLFIFAMIQLWTRPHICHNPTATGMGIPRDANGWYRRDRLTDLWRTQFSVYNRPVCVDPIENVVIFTSALICVFAIQQCFFLADWWQNLKVSQSIRKRIANGHQLNSHLTPPPSYEMAMQAGIHIVTIS